MPMAAKKGQISLKNEIADDEIIIEIFDPKNRPNPYPLFARLRQHPVSWQKGGVSPMGSYVVSTYSSVVALLQDPRISSDMRKCKHPEVEDTGGRAFIRWDPPDHDRLRRLAMRHFGPPNRPRYIEELRPQVEQITQDLMDSLKGKSRFNFVESFSLPLPVLTIAAILGVPEEDRPKFKKWSDSLIEHLSIPTPEGQRKVREEREKIEEYMAFLISIRRKNPKDDLISRMAMDLDEWGEADLIATLSLLLVAGHETTVNLLSNGLLTLLRFPDYFERIREEPDFIVGTVEELLRYEPPVQFLPKRTALEDIEIEGMTLPKGSIVTLMTASANRDPAQFPNPDQFNPERVPNAHLGFGSGIHYCFGAPLARMEAQIALRELTRRLKRPRLVVDPPPYRLSPFLRGPSELLIEIEGIIGV